MTKEKRAEIREQIKGGKMFFNTELLQALDALDLAESRLSKARETLGKYGEARNWDRINRNYFTDWGLDCNGYEPAQSCLAEIGGDNA